MIKKFAVMLMCFSFGLVTVVGCGDKPTTDTDTTTDTSSDDSSTTDDSSTSDDSSTDDSSSD